MRRCIAVAAFAIACAVSVPASGLAGASSRSDDNPADASALAPSGVASAAPARSINAATQPDLPTPAKPANAFINRPSIPLAQYRALKAAAAAAQGTRVGASGPLSSNTLQGHAAL